MGWWRGTAAVRRAESTDGKGPAGDHASHSTSSPTKRAHQQRRHGRKQQTQLTLQTPGRSATAPPRDRSARAHDNGSTANQRHLHTRALLTPPLTLPSPLLRWWESQSRPRLQCSRCDAGVHGLDLVATARPHQRSRQRQRAGRVRQRFLSRVRCRVGTRGARPRRPSAPRQAPPGQQGLSRPRQEEIGWPRRQVISVPPARARTYLKSVQRRSLERLMS